MRIKESKEYLREIRENLNESWMYQNRYMVNRCDTRTKLKVLPE